MQAEEDYGRGELEADTTLESGLTFYYLHVLGKADRSALPSSINYIRRRQTPSMAAGHLILAGLELNANCKAYFALKAGRAAESTEARHLVTSARKRPFFSGLEAKTRIPTCVSTWL